MKSELPFLKLILAGILMLSISCQPKTPEQLAEKDANKFFSNLDDSEKLVAHPMSFPENIPQELATQNKAKSMDKLQGYISEMCPDTKDFTLLKTYRKFGDDNKKLLFLEYEFCSSGILVMSYKVEEEDVTLFSVWPMKKEERPKVLFSEEQAW